MFKKIWPFGKKKKTTDSDAIIGEQIEIIEEIESMLSIAYKLDLLVEIKIRVSRVERSMLVDARRGEFIPWLRDFFASTRLKISAARRG